MSFGYEMWHNAYSVEVLQMKADGRCAHSVEVLQMKAAGGCEHGVEVSQMKAWLLERKRRFDLR